MSLATVLHSYADSERAKTLQRFFQTKPGGYGEGDVFLGLKTPLLRQIIKKYTYLNFSELQELLDSSIHECRMAGLFILVQQNVKADTLMRDQIFDFYVKNVRRINNRDLVDLTAPHILGKYLLDRNKKLLYKFAKSKNLRERRIAMVTTFAFLKVGEYDDTFKIAEMLLYDSHDLIHKAVGRMLREVGKRSLYEEEKFLKKHYKKMPRTMLRYAIERFEEGKRQRYLKGVV